MTKRDNAGRFVKGQTGNPNGRPRLDEEQAYLKTLRKHVSQKEFAQIIEGLKAEAKKGKAWAIKMLCAYLIGLPTQYATTEVIKHIVEIVDEDDTPPSTATEAAH